MDDEFDKEHFYFSDDDDDEEEAIFLPPAVTEISDQEPEGANEVEKSKSYARMIAAGIAAGAAVIGGTIAKSHHDAEGKAHEIEDHAEPNAGVVIETVKVTVFGWYKSLNDRIAARLQQGGDNAKSDVERITKEAREELTVIIKESKDKANKGWAANEKANAELEVALQKVQDSVLEQVTEVEIIVKTTTEVDVINKKLTAATEKAKASIDVHLDESTATIHEHVEKSKSHAGAIAGTIAAGTAIVGGVIVKKHHDHKEAEKKESDKHHTGVAVVDQGKSTTEVANVTKEVVVVDYVKFTITTWFGRLIQQVSARAKQGGNDAAKDIETITAKATAEITLMLEETAKKSGSSTASQQLSSTLTWAKGLVTQQSTQIQAIGIRAVAAKDSTGGVSTMQAQAKDTEEQIHVTLNQCDKTIKSTVTVTEEVVEGLIVKGDSKESAHAHKTTGEVEKKHEHISAGTVAGVAAGVAGAIAIKDHHDEKTKKDHHGTVNFESALAYNHKHDEPKITSDSFSIVLVNIKKAAEERHIYCENRLLDRKTPYVAISYRWGELDEQMVPATKDYYARVTSFQLEDFFKLCQAMLHEPDLKHIEYVWVDAICVDQDNIERRKATIYRMNDIYIRSTAIVAVPDLHAHHISTTTTANNAAMATIQKYKRYLYYLLIGTSEAQQELVKMDHTWMDTLGVPPMDLHRRELVTGRQPQQSSPPIQPHQQQQQRGILGTKSTSHVRKMRKPIERIDRPSFIQQLMTLMITSSSFAAQDTNTPTFSATRSIDSKSDNTSDQQLSSRMMVEFQRFEWQEEMYQRKTDIIQSMDFLKSLMEDWSNRTWVISEYHIAKKKKGSKLKFWYNQLSCPELDGHRFFEFDFNKKAMPTSLQQQDSSNSNEVGGGVGLLLHQQHPYTSEIIDLTRQFENSMRHRLTRRTVLEMMLQTKASKSIDRFHAIIPLSPEYTHHIKDRDTIAGLGISDMLSVRLKLMEWINTKDKLILLFSGRQSPPSTIPLLPTFATYFEHIKPRLQKIFKNNPGQCNFDIENKNNDGKDVRFVRSGTKEDGRSSRLDELWLCPRVYYAWYPPDGSARQFYDEMGGDNANKVWQEVGLDPTVDSLNAISIPLFTNVTDDNDDLKRLLSSDIQLVGSWDKNVWLLYSFCSDYQNGMIHSSRVCPMDRLVDGFRIY